MDDPHFLADPALWFDPNLPLIDFSQLPEVDVGNNAIPINNRKKRIRASRACIACRSRHMKCDSVEPTCTRCQLDARECLYTKSRRGGSSKSAQPMEVISFAKPNESLPQVSRRSTASPQECDSSIFSDETLMSSDATTIESTDPDQLLEAYYEYFHNAHPIALPRKRLMERLRMDATSLENLIPVLEYIGSVYVSHVDSSRYRQAAHDELTSSNLPSTAFSVQALILFSLAVHCEDEYTAAELYLNKAIDIALSINMHHKDFSEGSSEADPVLTESWRRTWWALYTCDVLFATISHYSNHRLRDTIIHVKLPCEDHEYESGKIPPPKSLSDYDNREFDDEEIVYSSQTYLIDAMRITSAVMSANMENQCPGDEAIASAEAKIMNWFLYLPKSKQEIISKDRRVDETMFFAYVMMNCEKLLLHRPHSRLLYSDIEERSKCTPPSSLRHTRALQRSVAIHTAKAMEAVESSIMLFALPSPHIKHSPLVICALALAVISQVSSCNHVLRPGSSVYEAGRDRIRLGLGALKSLVGAWGLAKRSVREVAAVSRELLSVDAVKVRDMSSAINGVETMSDEASTLVGTSGGIGDDMQYERIRATEECPG